MHKIFPVLLGTLGLTLAIATPALAKEEPDSAPASRPVSPTPNQGLEREDIDPQRELERGNILLRLGNPIAATTSFRKTIRKEPKNILAHEKLRRALIDSQRSDLLPEVLATLVTLHHHQLFAQPRRPNNYLIATRNCLLCPV